MNLKDELLAVLNYMKKDSVLFDYNTYECNHLSTIRFNTSNDFLTIEIYNTDTHFKKRLFYLYKHHFLFKHRIEINDVNKLVDFYMTYGIDEETFFQRSLLEDLSELEFEHIEVLNQIRELCNEKFNQDFQ